MMRLTDRDLRAEAQRSLCVGGQVSPPSRVGEEKAAEEQSSLWECCYRCRASGPCTCLCRALIIMERRRRGRESEGVYVAARYEIAHNERQQGGIAKSLADKGRTQARARRHASRTCDRGAQRARG